MNRTQVNKWVRAACVVVGVTGLILLGVSVVAYRQMVSDRSYQMRAINNARQIIMAIKVYAADHSGAYPTGRTANEAFRKLLQTEILMDERLFGCPFSPLVPDNEIGEAPDFSKAVGPGENHWMLVDGHTDSSQGDAILLFENALDTSWPPVWDGSGFDKVRKRGQAWKGGRVIIGLNDNTVSVARLQGKDNLRLRLEPVAWKAQLNPERPPVVLDIEE
jgi:hypothetical protein